MDCAAGRSFSKGFGEWVQAQGGTVQQGLFSASVNTDFGSQISQLSKHAGGRVLALFMSDGPRPSEQRASEIVSLFEHLEKLLRQRGVMALVVEHDVDSVSRCCADITAPDLGRLLVIGKPAEVRSNPQVISACLGMAA